MSDSFFVSFLITYCFILTCVIATFYCYFLSFFHYLSTLVCFIYTCPYSVDSYWRPSAGTGLTITELHVRACVLLHVCSFWRVNYMFSYAWK